MRAGVRLLVLVLFLAAPAAHAQTLEFVSFESVLGSGLQDAGSSRARLSTGQHGGVTVTIASSDSTRVLVAPDGNSVGSPSIDVFVPNGSTDAFFVAQALEGVTGTVAIDATAPGFASSVDSVEVVVPAVDIGQLATSTDVIDVLDPFRVRVGIAPTSTDRVQISQPARVGGGGLEVTVDVSDPAVGTLVSGGSSGAPVVVPIVEGASLTASNTDDGVAFDGLAPGTTTVSATIPGFASVADASREVTVGPAALDVLTDTIRTASGLRSTRAVIRLNGRDHGGVTATVTIADPSIAVVAPDDAATAGTATLQLTIPDGSTDAGIRIDGLEGQVGSTFLDVSAPGFLGDGANVEVSAPVVRVLGVSTSQDTLDPVDSFYATIGRSLGGTSVGALPVRPGGTPVAVDFAVSDSTVARIATSSSSAPEIRLEIPPGSANTPTQITSGGVAVDGIAAGTVTVSADGPTLIPLPTASVDVTVTEPQLAALGLPTTVGAGLRGGSFTVRLGASQHGGTTVRVESLDPSRVLLSSAAGDTGRAVVEGFVPDGRTDFRVFPHAVEGTVGLVDVDVTAPQFTDTSSTVEVVEAGIEILGLFTSQETIDAPDDLYARLGVLNASGSMTVVQARRPGAGPLDVTIGVSDPVVARLVTSTDAGPEITLTIEEGSANTPTNLAAGGVALDGLTVGSVDVSVSAPGVTPGNLATRTVDVTAPGLDVLGAAQTVGAGLQTNRLTVRLGGTDHGGVTVGIASSDPTRALIASDGAVAGQDSIAVFVPDGSVDANFWVQALDGVPGDVTITASAPGFLSDQTVATIEEPALEIVGLGSSFGVGDALDAFYVRVGIASSTGAGLRAIQARRAGAPPLPVTVTSSNGLVAEIVGPGGSGVQQTVSLLGGDSNTPLRVDQGGFAVRPVGTGSAVITATAPDFLSTGNAQRAITVTNPGIGLSGVPFFLGSSLQTRSLTATLDDRFHGGVTLRIESSDSTRALIAPDVDSPGASALEIALPNGTGSASYVIQAVTGASGPVSVNATAGTEAGNVALEIVPAALQFVDVPDSLDLADGQRGFVLRTGIASAEGDSLVQLQPVSAAAAPFGVSVVNDAPLTGELVTSGARADSVVVDFAAATFQSPLAVVDGGVAFDPVLAGDTTLRAVAPGFATTPSASVELVVFGDLTDAPVVAVPLALRQNVPNPFNPATSIRFSLPRAGAVELAVFDVRGRRVRTLVDGEVASGVHTVRWTGDDDGGARVASGVYFARLVADGRVMQRKMTLVQ